jgi:hypothetical protein
MPGSPGIRRETTVKRLLAFFAVAAVLSIPGPARAGIVDLTSYDELVGIADGLGESTTALGTGHLFGVADGPGGLAIGPGYGFDGDPDWLPPPFAVTGILPPFGGGLEGNGLPKWAPGQPGNPGNGAVKGEFPGQGHASVPEPAALLLLIPGLVVAARARRRA